MKYRDMVQKIKIELDRLELTEDPCSGIGITEQEDGNIGLYDDQANGLYIAKKVLALLQSLKYGDTTLDAESDSNIWQLLYDCAPYPHAEY